MKYSISSFTDLPAPIKVVILIVTGASLGTVVTIIPSGARWIVLIGLVFIGLLLLLYLLLLKWQKKRKAIPMERDLMKNASAAPLVSGSDPKVMAQQDDLRKKFESGIEEFRAHGNDFYDIPWYMIVGEPGSGKTEAIRHSNIGFPPGVQDMLQGSGGTLNMNWWFTEHAVILDTAGRMMFEQVEQGGGHDWKEFLNLLKKYRQHCPINGVLLVIPADSLIRDTADEIGKKAEKIARQFDVIQRTLGVRFPIFVVITKSDLINGFRDFFDNITDPRLQHQILGWSNPHPIDEPYRPNFIDQHVKMIKGRLFRRRLALMQQIICGESGVKEKRLADILYTFPQSITSIAPRLARYLELIFRAGSRWSGKPLFFRGIYFTSSMREGSALDGELAETLGVPVDSLPDGRVWEHDRAYFLRDLLLKKVFPEEGLVTSAIDAKKQHTRRKFISLATIAASVLLLSIYMIYAKRSYSLNIGDLNNYLQDSSNLLIKDPNKLSVVKQDHREPNKPKDPNHYRIVKAVVETNLSGMLAGAVRDYKTQWLFFPIAQAKGLTKDKLHNAMAIVYQTSVLKPFLSAACDVMTAYKKREKDYKWSNEDDLNHPELFALRQLIWIKANKALSEEDANNYSRSNFIDYLSNYIIQHGMINDSVSGPSRDLYTKHKSALHEPLRSEYVISDINFPASIMEDDPDSLNEAIETGIGVFIRYWQESDESIRGIRKLKDAIEEFKDAETQMLELILNSDDPESGRFKGGEQLRQFSDDWKDIFEKLKAATGIITNQLADPTDPSSLKALCEKVLQDVNDSYNFLLINELDPNSVKENEFLGGIQEKLNGGLDKITKELKGYQKYLEPLEEKFWARIEDGRRLYKIRFDMYSEVNKRLIVKKESVFEFNAIRDIKEENEKVRTELSKFPKGSGASSLSEASDLCNSVLNLDKQLRLFSVLQAAPNDLRRIKELVEHSNSNWDWTRITNVEANKKFDPDGAANIMSSWKDLGGAIDDKFKDNKTYGDKNKTFAEYSEDYCNYWLGTLPKKWINNYIPHADNWAERSVQLRNLVFTDVHDNLDNFGNSIRTALNKIQSHIPDNYQKKMDFEEHMESSFDRTTYKDSWDIILKNWKGLSADVFDARKTLLEKKPDSVAEEYFPSPKTYRPDSPEEFVYMYWTSLTENSLKILIEDAGKIARVQIESILNNYGNMFPLNWGSKEELDPSQVKDAYSLLKNIPLWEIYQNGTVGAGAKINYAELDKLNKLLKGLSDPLLPNKNRIKRIGQVLQGLPMGEKPYYCKISFVSPISAVHTRRIEIEQNGIKSGRTDIDTPSPNEFFTVEYGTDKSIYINFYQFDNEEKDPNVVQIGKGQLGPFKGRWAILKILHSHPGNSEEVQICLPVPDKDENDETVKKQLYLKLEFFRDKECNKSIPDFVQALLPKE